MSLLRERIDYLESRVRELEEVTDRQWDLLDTLWGAYQSLDAQLQEVVNANQED